MIIRKMRKGKELLISRYTGATKLRCPICKIAWLIEDPEDANWEHGECEHLKFMWNSGAHCMPPYYYGNWDTESFDIQLLAIYNKLSDFEDDPEDELPGFYDSEDVKNILSQVEASEIDEVWEYHFIEEYCMGGGGEASMFWGIKRK